MKAALQAAAFALALWAPAHAQGTADGLLVGSIALAQPRDEIGRISLHLRPLGDATREFDIAFANAGGVSDKADVQSAGERAWVFAHRLAPGRYEVVRMQACLAVSLGKLLLAPSSRRASCSSIEGDHLVVVDVKPGATVYVGRWYLTLSATQPPGPSLAWKPSRIYLRDTSAEDLALLAARKPGDAAPATVENPIAVLVGTGTKQ